MSNKKGGFIGWFLLVVLILFIVVPLIVGGITKVNSSNLLLSRASLNCYSAIPTKTLETVLCRPVFIANQSLPLLFVLITFVLASVLIYALVEEVPPFKNQVENGKKAPAAVFTILIAVMVSFFTSAPKYITLLLTISGSVVVYTIIAVFLVFVFLRIGLHTHKESLNYKKEYYQDLGKEKKVIRDLQRESKEVSQDIKLSKNIEKELKKLRKNDFQELKPLEKLESLLKSLEGPINKLNTIRDPKEKEYAFNLLKEHMPEIIKLTQRIEKEYHDEKKIDEMENKLNSKLKEKLANIRKELQDSESKAKETINNAPNLDERQKNHFINELELIKTTNKKLLEEITEQENKRMHIINELNDMRGQKANDIRAILSRINELANLIASGSLPSPTHILNVIHDIEDLRHLIKHNQIIIKSIDELEESIEHLIKKVMGKIGELQILENRVQSTKP